MEEKKRNISGKSLTNICVNFVLNMQISEPKAGTSQDVSSGGEGYEDTDGVAASSEVGGFGDVEQDSPRTSSSQKGRSIKSSKRRTSIVADILSDIVESNRARAKKAEEKIMNQEMLTNVNNFGKKIT